MEQIQTELLICGGGIAGLIAATAFGQAGHKVICVDPTEEPRDSRTTAFMQPSQKLLDEIGLWQALAPYSAPLQIMRILDDGGATDAPPKAQDFDASEISDQPFGWNLPNQVILDCLEVTLKTLPNVTVLRGVRAENTLSREAEIIARLSNGTQVRAQLLIGADGRRSHIREQAGIDVKSTRYDQKALTFQVTHTLPHHNVTAEIHRSGGPFTMVPLPDYEGQPSSAIVWMDHGAEARSHQNRPRAELEAMITERSCGLLGELKLISDIRVWPMMSQLADTLIGERIALIGEAAHVVPPIGAQGLNMSLGDIRALRDLSQKHALGTPAMLTAYNRTRLTELRMRIAGIDALNRASMTSAAQLQAIRSRALESLLSIRPIRQAVMKTGMGVRPDR